jgi:hypothetical protein
MKRSTYCAYEANLGLPRQIYVVVSNQVDLPSVPAVSTPIFDVSYPGCWTTGEGVRDMVGVLVTGSGDPESLWRSNALLGWSRWSDISASEEEGYYPPPNKARWVLG